MILRNRLIEAELVNSWPWPVLRRPIITRLRRELRPENGIMRAIRLQPTFATLSAMNGHRAVHSITSSARARSGGGMVKSSATAILSLMRLSSLIGCRTGRLSIKKPQDFKSCQRSSPSRKPMIGLTMRMSVVHHGVARPSSCKRIAALSSRSRAATTIRSDQPRFCREKSCKPPAPGE